MLPSLNLRFFVFALLSILLVDKIGAQEADLGEINIPNPSSYIENYEYDARRCGNLKLHLTNQAHNF